MQGAFDFSMVLKRGDTARILDPGETIVESGRPGTELFVIQSGEALIKIGDVIIETVTKGGIVGEMSLLDDARRSANVIAGTRCEVVAVDRERFLTQIRKDPLVAMQLMKLTVHRLRATNFLVHIDGPTQLPNRARLLEHLGLALSRTHRNKTAVGVIALDLDGVRSISDLFGHTTGDSVLLAAAQRLRAIVRKVDFISRVEGDQFAIVTEEPSEIHNAVALAQKLIVEMGKPYSIPNHEAELIPSVGVAYYPQDGNDHNALLKAASSAATRAKEQGGHAYQFFNPELNQRALETHAFTNKLRLALERDEFVLHYQPRVDLRSGHVVGVEALIRWNELEMGLVSPGMFIPLAEKRGMIVAIGDWVLTAACQQARKWQDAGVPPLLVAVNISLGQLRDAELPVKIEEILRSSGLAARYLELEITESTAMGDAAATVTALGALHQMGLALAVDDFGTGYSSLTYLKRFPIRYLKIDQSFIRGVPSDANDAAIVRTIMSMAKNLGIRIIAEGVETQEQLEFLRDEGCDEVQGYLISKPLPATELARFLRDGDYGPGTLARP